MLELAEQVLAVAPQHAEARKARTRAWKAIEPVDGRLGRPPRQARGRGDRDRAGGRSSCCGSTASAATWSAWATGVTFGQATPDSRVDVPLFADVSRLHATLTRDAEGYVLEAVRPVQVNGQPVDARRCCGRATA